VKSRAKEDGAVAGATGSLELGTEVGVDEKAFRKGHRYHTIVCDLKRSTVEFAAEERRTDSLAA
jgi:transposase